MLQISELAPAKINLALRVLGRRPDGYHEIDSVLLPLELADEVRLEIWPPGRLAQVCCACPGQPALSGPGNLAARAALRYLERAGRQAQVRLTIQKKIWLGSGLGGGSSDAGAALRALQRTFDALPAADLHALALELGADVPFFLDPRPARVRGIGGEVTPLSLRPLDLVLLNPGFPLGTAQVYAAQGDVSSTGLDISTLLRDPLAAAENDLEVSASRLVLEIPRLKNALLRAGALAASMTGSGPTVFGIFAGPAEARAAADQLRETTSFSVEQTRTLSA